MNRKIIVAAAIISLIVAIALISKRRRQGPAVPKVPAAPPPAARPSVAQPSVKTANRPAPRPAAPRAYSRAAPPAAARIPAPPPVTRPVPGVPRRAPGAAAPPAVRLYKELIPENITIVRCYYGQEIIGPPAVLGFDIDGSGFNSEFEKMITIDPAAEGISVRNLHWVTANQIHGEIVIGASAKTAYVYPKVLIHNLPVFSASDPFGVVRKGEVLAVKILEVAPDGRSERFRVVTNIDDNMFKQFWVEPTRQGLEVSNLTPTFPYAVDGTLRISFAQKGEYGLSVTIFSKEVFRRNDIRVVLPNLGKSGLVTGVAAVNPFRRPGDTIDFYVTGTGFRPDEADLLTAEGIGISLGEAKISYNTPTQIEMEFKIPPATPLGNYGITIEGSKFEALTQEKNAFTIVPPLWVDGLLVTPNAAPGKSSQLKLTGREFTSEFAKSVHVEMDEAGIHVTDFSFQDPSTLTARLSVDANVAPGDYVVHLSAQGSEVTPEFGSVIKVGAN